MVVILMGVPGLFCWQEPNSHLGIDRAVAVGRYVAWISCCFWYLWSLLAMKVFPSEDFSDLENYFREYELK